MKKRTLAAVLALCVSLALVFTGCGNGGDMPYSQYDLEEYVKVPEYKGMERQEPDLSISEAQIDERVKSNLQADAVVREKKEGKVKDGDTVNIDYKGTIKGKAFDGGTAEGQELEIGSGRFIDGFEDGLIGKEIGDTVELKLKFPKDYGQEELNGKDVVFTVTVNFVKEKEVPEFTDAWVAKNTRVKNREEYRKEVEKKLRQEKRDTEITNQKNEMWQKILDGSEVIKFPQEEVDAYVKQIETAYQTMAEQSGMEIEEYVKQFGLSGMEEYNEENTKAAQTYVKQQMVLYYVADKEGISYTAEQEEALRANIEEAGYTEETFQQAMGQSIDEYVAMDLTYGAVTDMIYQESKVVGSDKAEAEEPGEQEEQDAEQEPEQDEDAEPKEDAVEEKETDVEDADGDNAKETKDTESDADLVDGDGNSDIAAPDGEGADKATSNKEAGGADA